jgi:hypothetical protein
MILPRIAWTDTNSTGTQLSPSRITPGYLTINPLTLNSMSFTLNHSVSLCCNSTVFYSDLSKDLVCAVCYHHCSTVHAPADIPDEYYKQRDTAQRELIAEVMSYD